MVGEEVKKKRGVAIYVKERLNPKLIHKDGKARWIMVEIQRGLQKILIVNIYAPNEKQENFFIKLHEEIRKLKYQDYVIIGDFNAIFDRKQDKKLTKKTDTIGKLLPKHFLEQAEENLLIDAWRTKHPKTLDYPF